MWIGKRWSGVQLGLGLFFTSLLMAGSAGAQTLSGTVFRDYDASGSQGANEPGVAGVSVNVFDSTGTSVGTTTTGADGTYSAALSVGAGTAVRAEYLLPTNLDFLQPGASGRTTAVFADSGDSGIDVGFNSPAQYCDADPDLATSCFLTGAYDDMAISGTDAVVTWPRSRRGNVSSTRPDTEATILQVGSTYGLAHQRVADRVFVGAFAKRGAGYGPGVDGVTSADDSGAIYMIDRAAGSPPVALVTIPNAGGSAHGVNGFIRDSSFFSVIGKEGLGDLDLSDDENTLYVVNLGDGGLYSVNVTPGAVSNAITDLGSIPDPGCVGGSGDWRPMALKFHDSDLYVGGVCSGQTNNTNPAASDNSSELSAHVLRLDLTAMTYTTVLSQTTMDFGRDVLGFGHPVADWHAWVDTLDFAYVTLEPSDNTTSYPQPLLTDIEFDADGSMILGFRDRFADQMGEGMLHPSNLGDATVYRIVSAGDIVRACWEPSSGAAYAGEAVLGDWNWEGTGSCPDNDPGADVEFYVGEVLLDAGGVPFIHLETAQGGLAQAPRFTDVATTAMDPQLLEFGAGGSLFLDNSTGNAATDASRGYTVFMGGPPFEGKGNGLGDLEHLCEPAPIEIGNRVWCDAPTLADTPNGIQDPIGGSAPDTNLAGVTVALSCNGGAITASTMTAADGTYLFDDANVTGGIPPGATCTLSIDTSQAALGTCTDPTLADVGDPMDGGQDLRDSDGTDMDLDGTIETTFTVGGPGHNDHSLDFGLRLPAAPILTSTKADALLLDGDFDGMLDGGDTLRYTVVITNTGNADATAATYVSGVDASSSLVVGSVTTSQGTVTTGNTAGDTSVAVDIGSIAMGGGSVTITYDVTLNNPLPAGITEINCQGTVTASNHPNVPTDDPDPSLGGMDPTDTPVDAAPAVTASKVDAVVVDGDFDGLADAGDTVRYTVTLTNSGDMDGSTATFTSAVDANSTLVVGSVTTSQGTVTTGNTAGDASVAVDVGTLAGNGGSVTITYDVTVNTPIAPGVTSIACQGTLSGGNVPSTPTDDPDDPTTDDSTETPLDLGSDYGDAPDSYTTTASPSHVLDAGAGIYLGACVDSEASGQPAASFGDPADGDDSNDLGTSLASLGTCAGSDDEDGVTFDTMIVACSSTNQLTVTSAGMGRLDAWIDFDGNGSFDAGEQIFTSQALNGNDALPFTAPCSTVSGSTYARFRVSSAGGLVSSGTAPDGEVEDYLVTTKGLDLGDAPDSYGTMDPAIAAVHSVDPATPLHLGACVDTEVAGQATGGADGDDSGAGLSTVGSCATANDDEDGVTFDTMIVACSTSNEVTVSSVGTGAMLDAWIDFNADGDFADSGEQIFTSQALSGNDTLAFTAPCSAESASTYARFRISSAGGLGPVGAAMDGEVEDYAVTTKGLDFGDAPDSYTTTASPSHAVDPATPLLLGACVDTEEMGQPGMGADLDDTSPGLSVVGTCTGNDDEDGVSFDTMIVACSTDNMITVTSVGSGALLDAWIDFDGDGTFTGAGEQIFTSQALTGSDTLSYSAPCEAVSGTSYARFRVSTAGGLSFDGEAMDGEVEDYEVTTKGLDYGDAPDTYGTTEGSGGPSHAADPASPLFFGACVDTEADGQAVSAGSAADGDDLGMGLSTLGTCAGNDDEDGVTFDSMIVACGTAALTVTVSQAGNVDGWIDFGGDGSFDATDQILAAVPVVAGVNNPTFAVPCDTRTNALTYARFRLSSAGGLSATGGPALDGEVEDYEVTTKGLDFGDAPDTYGTTQATGGPSHAVDPASPLFLGACVDTEIDGQPVGIGNPADGDDLGIGISELGSCAGPDDEDGVSFDDMVVACGTSNLTVTASQAGLLDGWIDFNGDGDFVDPGEQVLASQALTAGANSVSYAVPCTTVTQAATYARFRLSSAGGLLPGGAAMDGEVEDYEVTTKGLDLGDAPEASGYPTLIASDGARHVVQPAANPTLGSNADTEADGQPSANHLGDDQNGGVDDEDGVSFGGVFVPGGNPVDITVSAGATGGLLNAWVDWNQDGDWNDAGEQIATDLALAAGNSTVLSVTAPIGVADGTSCARFRFDSDGGLLPTGLAMDGEVEDYPVAIGAEDPVIGISKELLSVEDLGEGNHAAMFELVIVNLGNVKLSDVQVTVDLADAFEDAEGFEFDFADSTDLSVSAAFDGSNDLLLLDGSDVLDLGESGSVLVRVVVQPGTNLGPYICSSTAQAISPASTPVSDLSQNGGEADPDDDGDPTNDNEPTEVVFNIPVVDIPTLGEWGLVLLSAMLATLALRRMRRSQLS